MRTVNLSEPQFEAILDALDHTIDCDRILVKITSSDEEKRSAYLRMSTMSAARALLASPRSHAA